MPAGSAGNTATLPAIEKVLHMEGTEEIHQFWSELNHVADVQASGWEGGRGASRGGGGGTTGDAIR